MEQPHCPGDQVSIHAPAGGATSSRPASFSTVVFQFTLPRGERPFRGPRRGRRRCFNSRSRGGSDIRNVGPNIGIIRFNSRSRGGSDTEEFGTFYGANVSIHAPAGGATSCLTFNAPRLRGFNSRSRGGSDPYPWLPRHVRGVSIHAPAGGATDVTTGKSQAECFNSRSRGGSDIWLLFCWRYDFCFNSRSRGGSDGLLAPGATAPYVSIHAPAGGATVGHIVDVGRGGVSIHAPAGGATRLKMVKTEKECVSIHAPAGGATLMNDEQIIRNLFQFTLPRGERPSATS